MREPSMDEILASIRRIIESNEPALQAGQAVQPGPSAGYLDPPANDDMEEVTLTVDSSFPDDAGGAYGREPVFDDGRNPHHHAVTEARVVASPAPAVPLKPLSLADVAARVRAASERATVREPAAVAVEREAPQAAATEARHDVEARREVEARYAVETRREVETPEHAEAMPAIAAARPEPAAIEARNDAPTQPDESVADAEARVHDDEARYDYEETEASQSREIDGESDGQSVSLLSMSSEERVARSFQDLAVAIDVAERRSFDEIAEDMLRPMLQEWLDDNLPTLVERLVREEIERVARGPRR
jgi:cell pole-organizing protein PopZ